MNQIHDLLKETLDLVRSHPELLTVSELKKEVGALQKSLTTFLAKSEEAKDFLSKDYIEICALLREGHTVSPTLAEAAKRSGLSFTGKEKQKKLAVFAIKNGIVAKVINELRMSPDDLLRQQFRALAHRPEDEIEDALAALLKGKQLEPLARAVKFEVVKKRTSKGETIDRKATLANARTKLMPFIDSIRDAR
jgi:hypothetical protein